MRQTQIMKNSTFKVRKNSSFKIKTKNDKDNLDWRQENEGIRKRKNGVNTRNNIDRGLERAKYKLSFPFSFNLLYSFTHVQSKHT